MKQVSDKQRRLNAEVTKIKKAKPKICIVCGRNCDPGDAMHLLNKNIFGKYYTEPKNIWRGHRECHMIFDDSKAFRSEQTEIIKIVREYATDCEVYQYFGV